MRLPLHKTKIVCTIGPASESPGVMEKMMRAGMKIARLNFSHGDFDSHRAVVCNLRLAARGAGKRLAIMGDLVAFSVLVDNQVNFCLIPEVPFTLDGLLSALKQRVNTDTEGIWT